MGLLDDFGGLLDNPGRAVGIDPAQIAPEQRNAYRGMVLNAMGHQLQGGNFFQSLGSIRQGMDERQMAELKRKKLEQEMLMQKQQAEQQAALQQQFQGLFGGGEHTGTNTIAGAAPGAGAPGAGAPVNPQAGRANIYRRAADMMTAAGNDEAAKRYHEIAESLDPRPKFSQTPVTVMTPQGPRLAVLDEQGNPKFLDGVAPKPELTAPVATADGMMTMDQLTGQMKPLGVMPHEPSPADVKEYEYARDKHGYTGSFQQWATMMANLKAPKTTIHNATNINEDAWGKAMGPEIAKLVTGAMQAGDSAQGTLATLDDVERTINEAFTGPGAGARTTWGRVRQTFGFGNPELQRKLEATSQALQGMSRVELQTAEFMKGQGPITENERALIRRAAGMDQNMTAGEIKAAMSALRRQATWRLSQAQATQQRVQAMPGMERLGPMLGTASGVRPEQPAAPPAAPAGSIADRARAELERRKKEKR